MSTRHVKVWQKTWGSVTWTLASEMMMLVIARETHENTSETHDRWKALLSPASKSPATVRSNSALRMRKTRVNKHHRQHHRDPARDTPPMPLAEWTLAANRPVTLT